jgi:membrane-bound lytic murein transglycosylase D
MKKTAIHYGLNVNKFVDERMNVIKSTYAAAKYFKDLYNIFNSWELALVAYNSGEYRIINLIRQHKSREYLALLKYFPKETANYIPKVMAAKIIMENLDDYKMAVDLPEELFKNYSTVKTQEIDLLKLADRYRMELKKIKEMNPDILIDNVKLKFELSIIVNGDPSSYRVRPGETLADIAKRFNIGLKDLIWANRLTTTKVYPGQTLRIASN